MTNIWIFPGSSDSKASATRQETQVQSLGQEDLLKKEMAIHSSILAWRIPWTEEPGGLQSWGGKELDTAEQLSTRMYTAAWTVVYCLHS